MKETIYTFLKLRRCRWCLITKWFKMYQAWL